MDKLSKNELAELSLWGYAIGGGYTGYYGYKWTERIVQKYVEDFENTCDVKFSQDLRRKMLQSDALKEYSLKRNVSIVARTLPLIPTTLISTLGSMVSSTGVWLIGAINVNHNVISTKTIIDSLGIAKGMLIVFYGYWAIKIPFRLPPHVDGLNYYHPICRLARNLASNAVTDAAAEEPATEPESEFSYSDIVPARRYNWFNSAFAAAGLVAIGVALSDIIATANGMAIGILPDADEVEKFTNRSFAPDS